MEIFFQEENDLFSVYHEISEFQGDGILHVCP